jgi:hypothetical protein
MKEGNSSILLIFLPIKTLGSEELAFFLLDRHGKNKKIV